MKLKGLHKRIFSLFTMVTFSLGMLAPDVMQAAQSTDKDMKLVASILNNSKKAYGDQEKGFDLFSEKVLSALPKSDVKFIKGVLSNVSALPSAEYKKGEIHLTSGENVLRVKLVNAATGETLVNGKRFNYRGDQSLKMNYERLFKTVNGSEVSWVDALMNIVIPQAHAADDEDSDKKKTDWKTIAYVIGGIIAVGLLVWWGISAGKEKTKREQIEANRDVALAKIERGTAQDANQTQVQLRELDLQGGEGSEAESQHDAL